MAIAAAPSSRTTSEPVISPLSHLADLATRGLVTRAGSGTAARERTLPLLAAFEELVPQCALQRGSVVSCHGAAAVSLALAVAAGPSQEGAWVGVVGFPTLGLAAAAEAGVVLERLVAVTGEFSDAQWADLLAACIDGFDVVVLGPGTQAVRPATVRRLLARLQSRGAVAVTVGAPAFGSDLRFDCAESVWVGWGLGHGVAQGRVARVTLSGRRVPRTREARLWVPAVDGRVEVVPAGPVSGAAPDTAASDTAAVVALRRTG
jgi:hypothetical protein